MPEFINPRVDWAFKRIFGTEDTKECLITFLNGVFEGEFVIKDVKHLKTEQTRHQKRERGVIFDVACETDDGRHIIVEMQKKEQRYFVDRALYYSAKAIVEQAKPGEWDFHLHQSIPCASWTSSPKLASLANSEPTSASDCSKRKVLY